MGTPRNSRYREKNTTSVGFYRYIGWVVSKKDSNGQKFSPTSM